MYLTKEMSTKLDKSIGNKRSKNNNNKHTMIIKVQLNLNKVPLPVNIDKVVKVYKTSLTA